jgi:hypothetical protein
MTTFTKSTFSFLFILFSINISAQTIVLTTTTGSDYQTICENSAITPIEYAVGNGATDAFIVSGSLPTGVVGTFSAGVFTIIGTPTSTGVFQYTVSTIGGVNTAVTLGGAITVNAIPVVSTIQGNLFVCQYETTPLSTTTSGGSWYTANPNIATIEVGSGLVTAVSAGTTTVTYSVTTNGCVGTANAIVTVNAIPVVAPITGNLTTCQFETLTLSNITVNGIWSSATPAVASINVVGIVTAISPGTTTISYSATTNGCVGTSTAIVIVNPIPMLSITNPSSVCSPATIDITSANVTSGSTSGTTFSYWTDAACTIPLVNPTAISVSGTYYIMAQTNNGCIDSAPVVVDISSPTTTTFNPISPINCGDVAPVLMTSSINSNPIMGTWNPSIVSNTTTTTYTFTPNAGNCATSTSLTITVNPCIPDSNLIASVAPTSVSQTGTCDGMASLVITNGNAPFSILYANNETTSTASNLCEGLNSVTVSDANGDTLVIQFIVPASTNMTATTNLLDSVVVDTLYNPAVINCVINYLSVDSAYINSYTILSDTSVLVNWSVVSSSVITNYSDTYFLNGGTGVYMMTLQIYCPNKSIGNFLTATDQLYFNPASLGIEAHKLNESSILIYPNPFIDQLTISLSNNESTEIVITDISGKVLFNKKLKSNEMNIDMSNFSAGQYMVTVKNENLISTRKIVK